VIRDWSHAKGQTELKTDVVIVGGGPGGAAVARVLSQAGVGVVLVEEGPAQPNFRPNMAHTQRFHMQEGGAIIARSRSGALMPIAAGRGVGGGSLINSAICWRTPDHVLDDWIPLLDGDDRFSPSHMAPVFDEIEAIIGVSETPERIAGENNKLIVRGATALGLPCGLLKRNTPTCSGCGLCNYGCPVGGKASVDRNLVPMAVAAGAIVQADSRVDSILTHGGRASGIRARVLHPQTREEVGQLTVTAGRVVICCGGIGTPRLLHASGLADRLGPAVGKGLHVHPGNAVLGLCDEPVHMWKGATQGAWFEDPELPGVLPHSMSGPPGVILLTLGKTGLAAKASITEDLPRVCGALVMVSDKGDGTVGARSDGRADVTYSFADEDVERIKKGMFTAARVLVAGGAKSLFCPVAGVGIHNSPQSLRGSLQDKTIADFGLYAAHPMATCRMGADPEKSVVAATAEAHGLPGLFIADSSVFPTSLGVNPQVTTMTMATMIARSML